MTVAELIKKLQEYPENTEVKIFDWRGIGGEAMKIVAQGVTIELTKEQVAIIEKEKAALIKVLSSYEKVFSHFGFIKSEKGGYSQVDAGWYAEIKGDGLDKYVWMVGTGLKSSGGLPGGYVYNSPEEIIQALTKALA